jgi:hypothetical protein
MTGPLPCERLTYSLRASSVGRVAAVSTASPRVTCLRGGTPCRRRPEERAPVESSAPASRPPWRRWIACRRTLIRAATAGKPSARSSRHGESAFTTSSVPRATPTGAQVQRHSSPDSLRRQAKLASGGHAVASGVVAKARSRRHPVSDAAPCRSMAGGGIHAQSVPDSSTSILAISPPRKV